jgi:heme-degrading monooxygenase HmoA
MLCAHTVRRLKPGTYEQFVEAFMARQEGQPPGLVRFYALRSLADPNEVVTFGFFDGTLEDLERGQEESGYADLRATIDPMVEETLANGIYEVAVDAR